MRSECASHDGFLHVSVIAASMLPLSMVVCSWNSMSTPKDVQREAVLFLAQLRHSDIQLIERAKTLVMKDREFAREVFSRRTDEWTLFHAFVLRGEQKLTKLALKAGVSANIEMGRPDNLPGNCSPLHLAAHRGDVAIIQLLLQNGADVNKNDSDGHAPIFYAIEAKNTLAVKTLIKYGADTSKFTPEQKSLFCNRTHWRTRALLCFRP
ncbi:putative ankyrin repeat protein RBE_0220 [Gigantopelta aegis]|uniref:putative ankyrin repeat protein RBE_0220 n=1 Tax=Gigantopelta aegis TaxID=1735272 RepID=UPI001B88C401|nr:putative ankyrin repeat protein RBE_0220 [Gigantopelta aegis]